VVTGSHIRRVDLETSNPVVAVTAQQIQQTGKLTLGDVVQDLPVITGGVQNPRVNNPRVNNSGATGQTLVGLRGLGASRTLILIDGQRVTGTFGPADLNAIPAAAVDRIEVLTDGASAVYGSDAIGGVINIILKSNYQGAQFQLNYGVSDHDDGVRKGVNFMFGQTSDKGSILAGIDYNKFDSIL
jgi:outer membrane receptor for ferrienterochelin and colicin